MDDTPTPIAEIDHGPSKFEVFLEENQKLLVTLAIAVFLGVLGYVGYTSYDAYLNAQAGEALSQANEETALQEVIIQHGNTPSAGAAALLLADIKAQESSEDAVNALRDFVNTYPEHPAIPSATTSLGLRLLNEGKLDEAKAQLNAVLNLENASFISPLAKIALGDIAKQQNDLETARQLYTEVSSLSDGTAETASKYSIYISTASQRLRFLETSTPTIIEKKVTTDTTTENNTTETTPAPAENAPNEEKNEKSSQVSE